VLVQHRPRPLCSSSTAKDSVEQPVKTYWLSLRQPLVSRGLSIAVWRTTHYRMGRLYRCRKCHADGSTAQQGCAHLWSLSHQIQLQLIPIASSYTLLPPCRYTVVKATKRSTFQKWGGNKVADFLPLAIPGQCKCGNETSFCSKKGARPVGVHLKVNCVLWGR
jgi:hypothetical protein